MWCNQNCPGGGLEVQALLSGHVHRMRPAVRSRYFPDDTVFGTFSFVFVEKAPKTFKFGGAWVRAYKQTCVLAGEHECDIILYIILYVYIYVEGETTFGSSLFGRLVIYII